MTDRAVAINILHVQRRPDGSMRLMIGGVELAGVRSFRMAPPMFPSDVGCIEVKISMKDITMGEEEA